MVAVVVLSPTGRVKPFGAPKRAEINRPLTTTLLIRYQATGRKPGIVRIKDGSARFLARFPAPGAFEKVIMARQEFPRVPKVREYAQIELTNGSVMTGYVFVEATLRIQDVLNSDTPFIPFIDEDDVVHLVNKTAIIKVRPYDQ